MNIKNIAMVCVAGMAACASALDNVEVTDVKARQRYPWNGKVDIDYTLDFNATEPYQMLVEVYDNVGKTNLPVKSVCTEGVSVEANPCMVRTDTRRIVWDASKDLPNGFKCTNVLVTCRDARTVSVDKLYCVIDLQTGEKEYLDKIPKGGWTDEHKTTKMVFRRIEAGSFMMGSPASEVGRQSNETQHKVTITKPYYIAIYELTEAQYCKICGGESVSKLPKYLEYREVRGYDVQIKAASYGEIEASEYAWPQSALIDTSAFVGQLRTRTGIETLDLPTEAMWEFACRGSTLTALNNGECSSAANMNQVGRYLGNALDKRGDASSETATTVGCYMPNANGVYDMIGNATEWCLDIWQEDLGFEDATNPKGKTDLTISSYVYDTNNQRSRSSCRVVKGGGFYHSVTHAGYSPEHTVVDEVKSADGLSGCRSAWRSFGNCDLKPSTYLSGGSYSQAYRKFSREGVRLVFSAE